MIRWTHVPGKLAAFTFTPLWEVGFGWFLMVCACAMPIVFFWYNGINLKQYLEWLFCLVFCVFFLFMGWNLAFQRFTATVEEGRLTVEHTLREPSFSGSWNVSHWSAAEDVSWKGEGGQVGWKLTLTIEGKPVDVYPSVKQSEILALKQAFEELKRSMP